MPALGGSTGRRGRGGKPWIMGGDADDCSGQIPPRADRITWSSLGACAAITLKRPDDPPKQAGSLAGNDGC